MTIAQRAAACGLLDFQRMDAIELLETQHREVDSLFDRLEREHGHERRRALFDRLADALASHSALEEMHFYPSVKAASTEELLRESLEEHLSVKRLIADLLTTPVSDPQFDAKVKVLAEQVRNHVDEERGELFPRVRRLLDPDQLEAIGQLMTSTLVELEKGSPRLDVPLQTLAAPALDGGYTGDHGGHLLSRVFPRVARLVMLPMQAAGVARRVVSAFAALRPRKRREA